MKLFVCNETNIITEEVYEEIEAGFCVVENYDYVYQKELPRFIKVPGIKPYGLPSGDIPKKRYAGIGNVSHEKQAQDYMFYIDSCIKSKSEVTEIRDALYSKDYCDVVWFRVHESIVAWN